MEAFNDCAIGDVPIPSSAIGADGEGLQLDDDDLILLVGNRERTERAHVLLIGFEAESFAMSCWRSTGPDPRLKLVLPWLGMGQGSPVPVFGRFDRASKPLEERAVIAARIAPDELRINRHTEASAVSQPDADV
jgi:hypothetical protein